MVGLIEYDNYVCYRLFMQQKQSGNSLKSIYKNMVLDKNFQISTSSHNNIVMIILILAIIMEIQMHKDYSGYVEIKIKLQNYHTIKNDLSNKQGKDIDKNI